MLRFMYNFRGMLKIIGIKHQIHDRALLFFTIVPCILILSKSSIYQLMHNRIALKEY